MPSRGSGWFERLNSTVFPEIFPQVTFFTLAFAVAFGSERSGAKISVNVVMLSVLTTILSFAINLRVSSANDRYNEGRRAWSTITLHSRTMALLIWIHTPPTTLSAAALKDLSPADLDAENLKGLIEKRSMINLVEAFSIATKHYLRAESGVFYEDLYHLISALPKYNFPSSAQKPNDREGVLGLWRSPGPDGKMRLPAHRTRRPRTASASDTLQEAALDESVSSSTSAYLDMDKGADSPPLVINLAPAENPPNRTLYHYVPPLVVVKPIISFLTRSKSTKKVERQRKEEARSHNSHVPLELLLFLNGYVHQLIRRGTLEPPLYSTFLAPVTALQDCVTVLERILTTPLPFAYSAHLRFSVYIYLIFLPFQVHQALGYLSIVGVAVAATMFLGFMELGNQLEDPFNYDDSDLDLDTFCQKIGAELREITAHPSPDFSFVFSDDNMPFGPDDDRSAVQILEEQAVGQAGVPGFRRALAKHYNDRCAQGAQGKKKAKDPRSIEVVCV